MPEEKDYKAAEKKADDYDPNAELDSVTGIVKAGGLEHADCFASIFVMIVCVIGGVMAIGYYKKSGELLYASAGFMPLIIVCGLFLLSLSLLIQSLKNSSFRERLGQTRKALAAGIRGKRFLNSLVALAMLGIYSYVLLRFLPFWLASLIVLLAAFLYLKAAKPVICVVISGVSIGVIILLFQTAFRVPMP